MSQRDDETIAAGTRQPKPAARSRDRPLRRIIEHTVDGMVIVDRDGSVRFANRAAEKLFGHTREELVGAPFGFPLVDECVELDLPGGLVAEMRVVELTWEGGPAWLASLRDITERKETEEIARRLWGEQAAREEAERERWRLLEVLDRAPAIVLTTEGPEHRCIFANPPARQLLGERELIGRPLGEALSDLRGQGFLEAFEAVFGSGRGEARRELELTTGDALGKAQYRLDLTVEPLLVGGAVDGLLCFAHDVTDQFSTREALESSMQRLREEDRRKDQFMAMLGHELRNPLAAIDGGLNLLEIAPADSGRLRRTVAMMRRQVRRQAALLDGLLDISSLARGKLDLRREVVPLAPIVETAVDECRDRLGEHRLEVEIPADPLIVDVDARRLAQVICNLLDNAIKYSGSQGRIRVSAHSQGQEAVLEVIDEGAGIAPDMLDSIFEAFLQAPQAEGSPVCGGLGIGLTLVRSLVEMHGGSVAAFSAGLGHGSRFVVRLPLAGNQTSRERSFADTGAVRRVLVVDDNVDAALSLSELLDLHGFETCTATTGREALGLAFGGPFDAVLVDLDLPDITGFELAERLRRECGHDSALIVAVSGFGDDQARERSRRSGIDLHMVKPVQITELVRLLSAGAA